MKKSRIRPPVKYYGGKNYLAPWLVSLFPNNYEQMTYLEPYCGAANVLLYKNKSVEEIISDIDIGIILIMQTIQNNCENFVYVLKQLKYDESTFKAALTFKNNRTFLDTAINEFVLRRMSRGGLKKAFAWSNRTRGGLPGDVNAWNTILDLLPSISERLHSVRIFNKTAIEILADYNNPNVLTYCDPPYLHSERVSINCYENEMDISDHIKLAEKLNEFRGKVMISGYRSDLYDSLYKKWRREEKKIANHASQQKKKEKKTEIVWMNY